MTDKDMKGGCSCAEAYGEGIMPKLREMPEALRLSCREALERIKGEREKKKRILVAIDGPCASGKTTLAGILAGVFGAGVVHTDDFVIPHWMKTPERLRVPGGNLDDKRLTEEVLGPWKKGEKAIYIKYDCHGRRFVPAGPLPEGDVLFLEGSYALLPAVRRYADVPLFLSTPWKVREERLKKRESPESLERFRNIWIPLEDAYFDFYGLPDGDCTVINGTEHHVF